MCGTGVTAVVVDVALELAEIGGSKKVYDGSWTSVTTSKVNEPNGLTARGYREWAQRVDESSGLIVKS